MNDGVKLLLERIKTHPEEFISTGQGFFGGIGRWHMLVQSYENYLTPEDRNELRKAMDAVMAEKFTEAVMKELMGVEDDDPLGKSQKAHSNTVLGGLTQGAYTSHSAQQSLHQQALMAQQANQIQIARTTALQNALHNTISSGASITSGTVSVPLATGGTTSSWEKFKGWLGL